MKVKEDIEMLNKSLEDIKELKERLDKLEKLINEKDNERAIENANEKVIEKTHEIQTEVKYVVQESNNDNLKNTVDTSSLESLKNSLLESLASKSDLSNLNKLLMNRIEKLDAKTSELDKEQNKTNKEIEKINEKIKALESQMLDKVSCEQYDSLANLVNALRSADSKEELPPAESIGPMISSKDLNLIKDVASRVSDLETRVNTLSK